MSKVSVVRYPLFSESSNLCPFFSLVSLTWYLSISLIFSENHFYSYSSKENNLSNQCWSLGGLYQSRTQYVQHHSLISGRSWKLVNVFSPLFHLTFRFLQCVCPVTFWSTGNVCSSIWNVDIHHLILNFLLLPDIK